MRGYFAGVMLAALTILTPWPSAMPAAVASGRMASQAPSRPPFQRVSPYGATSSTDRPVSPAVVATWFARVSPERTASLEVLVLWRGAPGWFTRGQGGGGMTSGGGGGTSETRTMVQRSSYGGIVLELEFTTQGAARSLRLQGRDVPLGSDNVVLVDGADTPQGPTVVGTRFLDPAMDAPHLIADVLRRSPEVVSFLRCDTQLPGATPLMQQFMAMTCADVVR